MHVGNTIYVPFRVSDSMQVEGGTDGNVSSGSMDANTTMITEVASYQNDILFITGILVTLVLMSCLRSLLISLFTHHASCDLHNAMFDKILRAPIWFFERNPVGAYGPIQYCVHAYY